VVIGGEDGGVFYVPYDWCLGAGKSDARCASPPALADGASLSFVTAFGSVSSTPPSNVDANQPLAFALSVRQSGRSTLATIDPSTLTVNLDPPSDVDVAVAGDGKFFTLQPKTTFAKRADGTLALSVHATYLVDFTRDGLKLSGGSPGGTVDAAFSFTVDDAPTKATLTPSKVDGTAGSVFELKRFALPLPTILPSYNQIGFDSLHYLVSVVELGGTTGVAWMQGAKLAEGSNDTIIDPATKSILALSMQSSGGTWTLRTDAGLDVEVMNAVIPFHTFRVAARLADDDTALGPARLSGSTVCSSVPTYGLFLQILGLCNPTTDLLVVFGGANLAPYTASSFAGALPTATFALAADGVTATLSGAPLVAADHVASILVVDATTGAPLPLDYGLQTTRAIAADGSITSVKVPFGSTKAPAAMRAYLMVDALALAKQTLP
jgi:hypothetical protein